MSYLPAGAHHEVFTTPERRALASLLDVVGELCQGLAAGQMPEEEWADIVVEVFTKHQRELRGEVVGWPHE